MKKPAISMIVLAGVLCCPAFAQRVEIFGGAQFAADVVRTVALETTLNNVCDPGTTGRLSVLF